MVTVTDAQERRAYVLLTDCSHAQTHHRLACAKSLLAQSGATKLSELPSPQAVDAMLTRWEDCFGEEAV